MEHIHKTVYINLEKRSDRRAELEQEFVAMGIQDAERFPAIEHSVGMIGCHMSHLAVLKMAREHGWDNVLIFEDDFQCIVDKETFHTTLAAFFEKNIPYDVVMLSYNVLKSEPYDEIVSYAREAQTASGYIVHKRFYDSLIENLETALLRLIETQQHWLYANDQCWKSLQSHSEWFYCNTRIGIQRPSYSDLSNRFVDYGV